MVRGCWYCDGEVCGVLKLDCEKLKLKVHTDHALPTEAQGRPFTIPQAMTYEHMFGSHVAEEWNGMHVKVLPR